MMMLMVVRVVVKRFPQNLSCPYQGCPDKKDEDLLAAVASPVEIASKRGTFVPSENICFLFDFVFCVLYAELLKLSFD